MYPKDYWTSVKAAMDGIVVDEAHVIECAAVRCAEVVAGGGILHVFGTAHSSAHVAEAFYRAGGLACVNAILDPLLSVDCGALLSTWMERQSGLARLILDRYDLRPGEPMLVFSVSGINDVPVEVAAESRARGLWVIAVTSRSYCQAAAEERGLQKTLITEADLVIDNHVPIGDAVLPLPGTEFRAASISTVVVALIYNLLLEQIITRLTRRNFIVPIFASANLPGASAHNAQLIARYRGRIRHF
ncbi:MAG TPA: SIS domain-containing protein [Chthoniobacterales bacterium]